MKSISIIAVITFSILFSICAIAANHPRNEYGSKMMKLEWCTEEFHTQAEFHEEITVWNIFSSDNVTSHSYELMNGGNAWSSDAAYSPETTLNIFVRTKKMASETTEDVKSRISDVILGTTGILPTDDDSRWWIKGNKVSYLMINM